MSFIRTQFLVRDESGKIIKGSASVCESVYKHTGGKSHSVQRQVERLGKVIWLSGDGKRGIFLSGTRGLVEYDSIGNLFTEVDISDPRLSGLGLFAPPAVHTVFGDSYLLLRFMEGMGFPSILCEMFPSEADRQRFLCHSLHSILKEGARISCDLFVQRSVLSYLADSVPQASLRSDTAFFTAMGNDGVKLRFFKSYIKSMRQVHPGFGRGCYVDSTPLPNDIQDNPFNALCSHDAKAMLPCRHASCWSWTRGPGCPSGTHSSPATCSTSTPSGRSLPTSATPST